MSNQQVNKKVKVGGEQPVNKEIKVDGEQPVNSKNDTEKDPKDLPPKDGPTDENKEEQTEKEAGDDDDSVEDEPATPEIPLYHDWESRKNSADVAQEKKEKKVEKKRDKWGNSLEFIMSSVSSAVGLGNIWRFSRTALENGGGAFLIPYLILVVLIARPLYYLEAAVGQFSSRGCTGMWDMCPIFRGVGWAMSFLSAITIIYYVAVLAFCGAYVMFGMADPLSWRDCNRDLYVNRSHLIANSFNCSNITTSGRMLANFGDASLGVGNTNNVSNKVVAELYFQYHVAEQLEDIDGGIGNPIRHLAVPLLIIWILVFLSIIFGTKTSGKAAYVTEIFPYLVLFTFLIRACTLKGSGNGIAYFFTPDWGKICKLDVWVNALNQCLFSLGIGFGNVVAYGSFNSFRQKLSRDAFVVSSMDTFTSLLAGITVFATLGVLAEANGRDVKDIANSGFSLLFVSYPEVLLNFGPMSVPQIFSFLFFLMLIVLGIGSAAAYFYTVTSTIMDCVPRLQAKKWYKVVLTASLTVVFFLLGIPMTTPGGIFVITLLDQFSGAFICYLVVLFEMIGIAWVYGMKSFLIDINFMTNGGNGICNKICTMAMMIWGYCMPILLIAVQIAVLCELREPTEKVNGEDKKFPFPVLCVGAALPILMALMIPGWAIYVFFSRKTGSWYKKYMASTCPNNKWGPKDPVERQNWIEYKRDLDDRCFLYIQTFGRLWKNHRANLPDNQDENVDGGEENRTVDQQLVGQTEKGKI